MSKKPTMKLPPIVGIDPSLSGRGTFLTAEERAELAGAVPQVTRGFSKNAGTGLRQDIASRGTQLVLADPEYLKMRHQPYREPDCTLVPCGAAPATYGMISTTLARHRASHAAYEKQLKFYTLLETKYGAIKGNDRSYLEALEMYHNDKERKEEEKMRQSAIEKRETERKKREKDERKRRAKEQQEEYIRAQEREIERQRQENIRREQMRQKQQEREDSYRRQQYQQQYQHQHQYQEQPRPQSQQGYARGGPAEEPQLSPRSRLSRRHPSPKTKQDALSILQLDPRGNPTQREIKTAFNKMAIRLHPDKNLDNPDEASVLFKQVHSAYKLLKPQAGGVSRRIKRKRKAKINKSRKHKTTKRRVSKRRK